MSKRGQSKPWKVTYTWDDGTKGKVSYATKDKAEMCAERIRNSAACQERTVEVTVTEFKTALQQKAELDAIMATFNRPAGSSIAQSELFPGWRIGINFGSNPGDGRAPYTVFREGDRLKDHVPCYTFDGAVATVIKSAS